MRLWSSGFELNTNGAAIEWSSTTGTPSIQTSTVRSGTYAGEITSLSSGARKGWLYQNSSSGNSGPFWARVYFRVATLPTANNYIMGFEDGISFNGLRCVNLVLTSTGTLRFNNNSTLIGLASSALNLNQWYRLEIMFNRTAAAGSQVAEAMIDGIVFATSSTLTITNASSSLVIGGNLGAEAQTTGDWFFDDIAINDSTGSFQNSYPGDEKLIVLRPNASGDSNQWDTDAASGTTNNYTHVNEVTPNDATSYVEANTAGWIDMYNLDNSGIGASDTVNVVHVGGRFHNIVAADATTAFKFRIEKTGSGTVTESSAIVPNTTIWNTNATAAPRNYPITLYQDPDGAAWTQTTLDSAQIGLNLTTANTRAIDVTAIWALVGYTPAATTTTSTSSTSSSTSVSTSTSSTSVSSSTSTSISTSSTSVSTSSTSTSTSTTASITTSTSSTSTSTTVSLTTSTSSTSSSISTSSTSTSTSVSTSTSSTSASTSVSTSTSSTSTSTSQSTSTSSTSQSASTSRSTSSTSSSTSTSRSTSTSSTSTSVSTSVSTSSTSTSVSSTSTSTTTSPARDNMTVAGIQQPRLR